MEVRNEGKLDGTFIPPDEDESHPKIITPLVFNMSQRRLPDLAAEQKRTKIKINFAMRFTAEREFHTIHNMWGAYNRN